MGGGIGYTKNNFYINGASEEPINLTVRNKKGSSPIRGGFLLPDPKP